QEAELARIGAAVLRHLLGACPGADRAPPRKHPLENRILGIHVLGVPLIGRLSARMVARHVRILCAHRLEDRPLALIKHVEHVGRIVDAVRLALAFEERTEKAVTVAGWAEEDRLAAGTEDQRRLNFSNSSLAG